MKKIVILPLLILTGCVSQTVEKIQSDPENIQKALYVQNTVNAAIDTEIKRQKNSEEYINCMEKAAYLHKLKNKNKLSKSDMEWITTNYPSVDIKWPHHTIQAFYCDLDYFYSNSELEKEIKNFCYTKYWRGNWFTEITLFPLRMTNELLTIGTLGIFPALTGSCSAGNTTFFTMNESNTSNFVPYCWKPGATWNYDTCKKIIRGNYEWKYKSKDHEIAYFTDDDSHILWNKIVEYCDNPPEDKPYGKKLCKGNYTNGCLIDLSDYSVTTFGTRNNGVIVSTWSLGLDNIFVYDDNDYYDGQDLKTGGYYYTYVGNYNDTLQKLPAFRKSEYKVPPKVETSIDKCCKRY